VVQQNHFLALEDIIDPQPLTVTSNTSLVEVVRLMQEWGNSCRVADDPSNLGNSSCVLVVENSRLRGIFTERDLVKLIAAETVTESVTVDEVMSQDLVTLTADNTQDIFIVLNILRSHSIRHLPVVDKDDNLLGLITAKNLRQKLQPINMMKWRKVKEIMETEVIYAAPDDSVRSLAKLMTERNSSYVAIAKSKLDSASNRTFIHPLGIVTERDIIQLQNLNLDLGQPARNIMSAPLFLIDPEDTLWSVKQQMEQHRVRRLLVGSQQEELLGIVTQTSLLQVFDPSEMYEVIEVLQQQICQLETDKELLLENRQAELEQEVKERTASLKSTQEQLQQQVRQQKAIAKLGQFALKAKNLESVLEQAVNLVATILDVEYCKVLELLPNNRELLLTTGVGWYDELVGSATVEVDRNSQAGYTLLSSEPIIVENLLSETRFSGPNLLLEHQVISGMSITISGQEKPFGILGVHTTQHRNFSQDDVTFIQAIANIIAQVNERQRAELALQQSEQKFRAIFERTFQFIGLLEPNGNLIEANQTALDFVGLTSADVRGKPFWETPWWSGSTKAQKLLQQGIERSAKGEFVRFEVEHPGTEDRLITVDFSLTPIQDETGKVVMLIPEGRDISELKQTESQLRESQERYSLAVEGSSSGLWDWNILTNEVFYAPRWKEILGTDAELPNTVEAWSTRLHPEDRDRVLAAVQAHLEERIPYNVEYRLQKKDGKYCWILARGQAIWDEQGQAVRMAGSIDDISEQQAALHERKRREEILRDIAHGVSIEVGENFFQSLVEYLSKTLKVDYAFVGELIRPEKDKIKTLAVYGKGKIIDNFEYLKVDTPCKNVIEHEMRIYPEAIQQLFPKDRMLQEIAAESYAGIAIVDSSGQNLGLISVIDSKPFENNDLTIEVLKIFASRVTSELERLQAETELQQSNQILKAISSIQTQFLTDAKPAILFDGMLEHLLELTQSEYGFIGEIHLVEDGNPVMGESYMKFRGRPYLKTHAITNIAWNESTRAFYAENAPKGMEFHNLQTLFGAVIVTGEPVIANSPSDDPRRGGLPEGHPPLNAFLGVPFYKNGEMTGMVGIANRKGGYNEDVVHYLRPFLDTCSRVIEAYKSDRQRQQALAKIREQAALLDVATDAIMVRSLDDRILYWNRGAEDIYGWTKAEATNKFAYELLYREFPAELNKTQQTVIDRGEWQGELKQVTKADKDVIVQSRWTLVRNDAGQPQSYLVVKTDITEQKQLEAQFLRTQRLESLGTLAGGIAHDLNNILAPILGFAKLLPLKLPDVDDQTKSFFKIMENNAQRGTALVKQILTFSRGLEGEKGIVQVRHLIAEIAQIIGETFPKSIELEINAPKTLWTVNADVNQLHQVLMNLAVNARDAMPDGGKLTIEAENFLVDSSYARLHLEAAEGDYLLITVTDTGVGIPPEIIDRIFEPFFTTKEIGRGTGLGLSTVIGIIKSHGGFIDVTSQTRGQRGTTVKIFIPASKTAASTTAENDEFPQGNGELILVVDDESSMLEVTKATLETYNYQVLTADNGIEAIALYVRHQQNVSLVIMDIMMPGMDGKTAIRTLKQINPELEIIAVSGLITSQEILVGLDGDVTAFMSKPYGNDELLIKVREVVSRQIHRDR
jgi:PAS domain S-box-containing protein